MSEKSEQKLQIKLCSYIKNFYPNVYFSSDPSGLRVTPGLRNLLKATRSRHAQLDITILAPSRCRKYHALILELKKESPYKKDGQYIFKLNKHISDQIDTMRELEEIGYRATWCWSFEMGKDILAQYLGPPEMDNSPLFETILR